MQYLLICFALVGANSANTHQQTGVAAGTARRDNWAVVKPHNCSVLGIVLGAGTSEASVREDSEADVNQKRVLGRAGSRSGAMGYLRQLGI